MSRVGTAMRMGLREQGRRPLLVVLLIGLPGGDRVLTTMPKVHGAVMAAITIAFLAGLCGVFIVQAARQSDRRLIVAGFTPLEAIAPRLFVLRAATGVALVASMLVTALSFAPRSWSWFVAGNLLVGLTYGGLGALAGAVFDRLGATYMMLFAAMLDLGVAQNPMFGSGEPATCARILPGYGAGRLVIGAGFASGFHAWSVLALALGWTTLIGAAVVVVLGRLHGITAATAMGRDVPVQRA